MYTFNPGTQGDGRHVLAVSAGNVAVSAVAVESASVAIPIISSDTLRRYLKAFTVGTPGWSLTLTKSSVLGIGPVMTGFLLNPIPTPLKAEELIGVHYRGPLFKPFGPWRLPVVAAPFTWIEVGF